MSSEESFIPPIYLTGEVAKLGHRPEEQVSSWRKDWHNKREAIGNLPSSEKGLDLDRVYGHLRQVGLSTKPIKFLDPENFRLAEEIAPGQSGSSVDSYGRYIPLLGLILVKRDPEMEELNTPEFTERVAVHEAAHGTNYNNVVNYNVSAQRRGLWRNRIAWSGESRHGFVSDTKPGKIRGVFLEEAYADLEAGIYVKEVLGRPAGFGGREESPSSKYSSRVPTGEVDFGYGFQSLILEMLTDYDPAGLHLLRQSRHSDQGYQAFVDYINNFPGLFQELQDFDMDDKDAEGYVQRNVDLYQRVRSLIADIIKQKLYSWKLTASVVEGSSCIWYTRAYASYTTQ